MAISNNEFNLIMREYEERRYGLEKERMQRTREIYEKIPRIKEIEDEISDTALENIRHRFKVMHGKTNGDENNSTGQQLHSIIEALKEEKKNLLLKNGFPEDYMSQRYICGDCMDTGYIGNEKCHCLKQRITEYLYSKSNLSQVLEKENFSTFNISLYSDNFVDELTGINARENIKKVLGTCKAFVDGFGKDFLNLFIYGSTGVGKTFLTNCIAKEIMDKSYSVIYVSAMKMFDIIVKEQFSRRDKTEDNSLSDFVNCDLLIIDDLGTEMATAYSTSALFECINERFLKRKPVIISTNLSFGEIRNLYSERVFSRITGNYKILKVFGRDLRNRDLQG